MRAGGAGWTDAAGAAGVQGVGVEKHAGAGAGLLAEHAGPVRAERAGASEPRVRGLCVRALSVSAQWLAALDNGRPSHSKVPRAGLAHAAGRLAAAHADALDGGAAAMAADCAAGNGGGGGGRACDREPEPDAGRARVHGVPRHGRAAGPGGADR
jgi:hypothetical protein